MKPQHHAYYAQSMPQVSRRTFVKGMAIGGAAASLGFTPASIWAQKRTPREATTTLSGTNFDLKIDEFPQRRLIDLAVLERRDERDSQSSEGFTLAGHGSLNLKRWF